MKRRSPPRRWWMLDLGLILFVAGGLTLGPRLLDARAAFEWTRYHAAQGSSTPRPADHARRAGRSAARVIERAAPLPLAAEAARLALSLGRNLESRNAGAALSLYTDVRAALDAARASRWRGIGLAALAAQARALENAARASAGGAS